MAIRLMIGAGLGAALGGVMGYFGSCATGACPLTANPLRGAIFGTIFGLMAAFPF